jgi:nitrogen regulatory protein P-II 2
LDEQPTTSSRSRAAAEPSADDDWLLIALIIKPFRLDAVMSALRPFHVEGITATEVRGYGRQKGHLELYRGAEYVVSFIPKLKVEFAALSSEAPELVQVLQHAARTGRIGDGKVFIQKETMLVDVARGESI